jgi:hypothetical protein
VSPGAKRIAKALAGCSMLPGSWDKRFARDMARLAETEPDKELTDPQKENLIRLAHKYRRQLGKDFLAKLFTPIEPPVLTGGGGGGAWVSINVGEPPSLISRSETNCQLTIMPWRRISISEPLGTTHTRRVILERAATAGGPWQAVFVDSMQGSYMRAEMPGVEFVGKPGTFSRLRTDPPLFPDIVLQAQPDGTWRDPATHGFGGGGGGTTWTAPAGAKNITVTVGGVAAVVAEDFSTEDHHDRQTDHIQRADGSRAARGQEGADKAPRLAFDR